MAKLRAVSWAAVSSLPQAKKISVDEQLRVNAAHAIIIDAEIQAELVVPGESRLIILVEDACRKIPAYRRLVDMIVARSFDVLIYLDCSRLGRKASLSMAIVELCHDAGIATYETESSSGLMLGDTYDQMLVGAIKSVGAQQEIVKLVERNRFGMIARAERGDFPAAIPFGYRAVFSPDGSRSIEIDEQAARTLRRLFDLYISGLGMHAVADTLNNEGLPGVTQARWTNSAVRALIIRPWKYAGFAEINHDSKTGREFRRAIGKAPAIITPDIAAQVDFIRSDRANQRIPKWPYRFTGCVWCETCGAHMHFFGADRQMGGGWRCDAGRHSKTTVGEAAIIEALRAAFQHLSVMAEGHSQDSVLIDAESELSQSIEQAAKDLAALDAQLEKMDEAFAHGIMDLSRYETQVRRIDAKRADLLGRADLLQEQRVRVGFSRGRSTRRSELMRHGLEALYSDDIVSSNAFLRTRIRVWCANHRPTRIEFK